MPTLSGKNRAKTAELCHALADETRLDILDQLKDGERCVCELTDALQAGQSRLSFHLKVLKDAGLIQDRPEGRWIYYAINADAVAELEELVASLRVMRKKGRSDPRC
ncbi:MAG: metalloregulator ArsR/SmtB family transcription factor [Nitrospirae bacterium]|nr:metalloregulator ArsR/SmtB family transcription factor [Nitrospirota bacterium]